MVPPWCVIFLSSPGIWGVASYLYSVLARFEIRPQNQYLRYPCVVSIFLILAYEINMAVHTTET